MLSKPKDVAQRLNIEVQTLRGYERAGLITCEKTPGGHRRYDLELVTEVLSRKLSPSFGALLADGEGGVEVTRSATQFEIADGWADTFAIQSVHRESGEGDDWGAPAPFLGVPGSGKVLIEPNLLAAV